MALRRSVTCWLVACVLSAAGPTDAGALSEAWIASTGSTGGVQRYDLDGNSLSSFDVGDGIADITVIPEPSTSLLVSTGLLGLATRRRRPSVAEAGR